MDELFNNEEDDVSDNNSEDLSWLNEQDSNATKEDIIQKENGIEFQFNKRYPLQLLSSEKNMISILYSFKPESVDRASHLHVEVNREENSGTLTLPMTSSDDNVVMKGLLSKQNECVLLFNKQTQGFQLGTVKTTLLGMKRERGSAFAKGDQPILTRSDMNKRMLELKTKSKKAVSTKTTQVNSENSVKKDE